MDEATGASTGIVAARAQFAAIATPVLARQLSRLLRPFDAGKRLTNTACFFADRSRLLVAVGPLAPAVDLLGITRISADIQMMRVDQ